MAGWVRSHAKTYIPVGRRQDNPCLPCLASPLHNQHGQMWRIVGGERACVLISITSWHGCQTWRRDCQCFPDMAPAARLKTRSVNRDGLEPLAKPGVGGSINTVALSRPIQASGPGLLIVASTQNCLPTTLGRQYLHCNVD